MVWRKNVQNIYNSVKQCESGEMKIVMSSGSSSDNSSSASSRSSSAESIPDLVKLKPYDWEPRRSVIELEKV